MPTTDIGRKQKPPPLPASPRTPHTEAIPVARATAKTYNRVSRKWFLLFGGAAILLMVILGALFLLLGNGNPADTNDPPDGVTKAKRLFRFTDHTDKVQSVAISHDGRFFASCGDDGIIYVYERKTGKKRWTLEGHKGIVHDVAFSPDGTRLASAGFDNSVRIWDLTTGRPIKLLSKYTGRVFDVEFSNDGNTLFSSSEDETISAWNLRTFQLDYSLTGHGNWVYPLAVLPERIQIACGDFDGEVRIWNVCPFTGRKTYRILGRHRDAVYSVALLPNDSDVAVSAGEDGDICFWSISDARKTATLKKHHDGAVETIAFSRNGRWMASGGRDGQILIWDWENEQVVHRIREHTAAVHSLVFSHDSRALISGSYDHAVCMWELPAMKE